MALSLCKALGSIHNTTRKTNKQTNKSKLLVRFEPLSLREMEDRLARSTNSFRDVRLALNSWAQGRHPSVEFQLPGHVGMGMGVHHSAQLR